MEDFDALLQRLTTLEIDTIVSDGISAERMPADGHALIRIAQLYKDFLGRVVDELRDAGVDMPALPEFPAGGGAAAGGAGRGTPFEGWTVRSGGFTTFGVLREAAQACRTARAAAPRPNAMKSEHDAILSRVAGSCGDIQALLSRPPLKEAAIDEASVEWAESVGKVWPDFDRDGLLTLRRIWETGVDVVVMQTLVRLDGGVTTRVLDGWDGSGAASVHDLHYRAVDISLSRWGFLVQTAKDLAGFFFGGGPGGGAAAAPGTLGDLARTRLPTAPAGRVGVAGAAG